LSTSSFPYSAAELDRFRQVQRLAYDIAEQVESQLEPGMTEIDICARIAAAHARHDIAQVFHEPFAWVGGRTVLGADWITGPLRAKGASMRPHASGSDDPVTTGDADDPVITGDSDDPGAWPGAPFFPTDQSIVDGAPVILDLAPVVDGISTDIGFSCVVGTNATFRELDRALPRILSFLLEGVRAGTSLRALYQQLDVLLAQRGWENCHQHYPDRALGHVVFPLGQEPGRPSPLAGFGTAAAEGLRAAGAAALENGTTFPVWNDSARSDYPASPGLWAVEPHIGLDGVGVKVEEILVVTENDAFWLDDHLPHAQRWAAAGYSIEPLGRS
jgi:Xaa-Pro aminopeptidase